MNVEKDVETISLISFSTTFPTAPASEFIRENVLGSISLIIQDSPVIYMEGPDGCGKTTILAQFAKKHPNNTFSFFLTPTKFGCDPDMIQQDFLSQLNWAIHRKTTVDENELTDMYFKRTMHELISKSTKKKELYYFVIDGIEDIEGSYAQFAELILDKLPIAHFPYLRFIFSGESGVLRKYSSSIIPKSFTVYTLTFQETKDYLKDLIDDIKTITEIYKTTRGIVGHLASIRRILSGGGDLKSLISNLPEKLPALFEIEWGKINSDREIMSVLSMICFDSREHTGEDISKLLAIDPQELIKKISGIGFIQVNEKGKIGFVSESFRKFASHKLEYLKPQTIDIVIRDLQVAPANLNSINLLPDYLYDRGRHEELLAYLSPETIGILIEQSQSCVPLQNKTELGIEIALSLKRDSDLTRFGLQKSILDETTLADIRRLEIEAYIALGNYELARTLAQGAKLKEDRLHLLAIYAKGIIEKGLAVDAVVSEQIRQLCSQIDFKPLGEKAGDIACDLINFDPNIAIEILEQSNISKASNLESDAAMAKLAVSVLGGNYEQEKKGETLEIIQSRFKNPKMKTFSNSAQLLLGKYPAQKAINEANNIEKEIDKVYWYRQWALANKHAQDSDRVIETALALIFKTTDFTLNARILRELAEPLPYLKDYSKVKALISRFDSQKGNVYKFGPIEDFIILQLILAQAENNYDCENAKTRFLEIYFAISELTDYGIKAPSLARLAETIHQCTQYGLKDIKFADEVSKDLTSTLSGLLENTAGHYVATKSTIKSMAKINPETAINLAMSLNTVIRRDRALRDIGRVLCDEKIFDFLSLEFTKILFSRFSSLDYRNATCLGILEAIYEFGGNASIPVEVILFLSETIMDSRSAEDRCRGLATTYLILKKISYEKFEDIKNTLLTEIDKSWKAVDTGMKQINVGFNLICRFASEAPETAERYLTEVNKLRQNKDLEVGFESFSYLSSLKLSIRAFGGLISRGTSNDSDLTQIGELIERIPSNGEKTKLWAEVALKYYLNDNLGQCKKIVAERVNPKYYELSKADMLYREHVLIEIAPALFLGRKESALELMQQMNPLWKDMALSNICEVLAQKSMPQDPYDSEGITTLQIEYGEILDICDLANLMETDSYIYWSIKTVCKALDRKKRNDKYSREQKSEIIRRLEEIIKNKLPSPKYITHEGFKIIALAQLFVVKTKSELEWKDLIAQIEKIPNKADQAFVYCTVAGVIPNRYVRLRQSCIDNALEKIKNIPVDSDRISRYETAAEVCLKFDRQLWEKCLKEAMRISVDSGEQGLEKHQKRIIEIAYRYDETFAETLTGMFNDDPAKSKNKAIAKAELNTLKVKKDMSKSDSSYRYDSNVQPGQYSDIAWNMLGGLNSGKLPPLFLDQTRQLITLGSKLPLVYGYPVWAFVLENIAKQYSKTPQAFAIIHPIYEACICVAQLSGWISSNASQTLPMISGRSEGEVASSHIVIAANEKEKAKKYIDNWLSENSIDKLIICDPYFGKEELEMVKSVLAIRPNCVIDILASKLHQEKERESGGAENAFRNYWRQLTSIDAASVTITLVGFENGKSPIHDRWILSDKAGLRLGTSLNGLGGKTASEISKMSEVEVSGFMPEVSKYLTAHVRDKDGQRLDYSIFTL